MLQALPYYIVATAEIYVKFILLLGLIIETLTYWFFT